MSARGLMDVGLSAAWLSLVAGGAWCWRWLSRRRHDSQAVLSRIGHVPVWLWPVGRDGWCEYRTLNGEYGWFCRATGECVQANNREMEV